ncbi:Catenin Alpha-2 [Manis pentadactyla]|nr:Catenin Alpha-2 [Manis pentadactyla]
MDIRPWKNFSNLVDKVNHANIEEFDNAEDRVERDIRESLKLVKQVKLIKDSSGFEEKDYYKNRLHAIVIV